MAFSKIRKYRAQDLSEATVSMRIFEDESQGLHHVIRSLPAGMDIAPDCWRFEKQGFAERKFNAVCTDLEQRGFAIVSEDRI
jgi:hypothetical protein